MRKVGLFEAKNKLSELVEAVRGGEEIVITKRGQAVARLVPAAKAAAAPGTPEAEAAMAALDARRVERARKGKAFTREEIVALVREGRKY